MSRACPSLHREQSPPGRAEVLLAVWPLPARAAVCHPPLGLHVAGVCSPVWGGVQHLLALTDTERPDPVVITLSTYLVPRM